MAVIQMSERELTRLRVLIDLSDDRLTVGAAGVSRRGRDAPPIALEPEGVTRSNGG
jgi:hypothetical protein